jgi:hypothetical protein
MTAGRRVGNLLEPLWDERIVSSAEKWMEKEGAGYINQREGAIGMERRKRENAFALNLDKR